MNRRQFFLTASAASLLPGWAAAYPSVPYAPTTWPDLRDSGSKIILNFRASWSITCQIKQDIIAGLIAENPAYADLTFVDADWDTFGRSEWVQRRLKVKRRSTLIGFRGKSELARLVNAPYEQQIRSFLDQVVSA
ncbi:thioredoxin [Aliishimia ponticola]|uniref:Thioredoxin n=1 Tax=Aliishimia ponticola TaxID=2499833 RepID=A0A4S4N6I0_9RHOB|nr:thioredoxin family protein [Aliishimia ponticola]THH34744.1 thioredoxin [Aliishimia ponticola]